MILFTLRVMGFNQQITLVHPFPQNMTSKMWSVLCSDGYLDSILFL